MIISYFKKEFYSNKDSLKKVEIQKFDIDFKVEIESSNFIQVSFDYSHLELNNYLKKVEFFVGEKVFSFDIYPEWEAKFRRFYLKINNSSDRIDKVCMTTLFNRKKYKVIK